jgi:hypothetical protein
MTFLPLVKSGSKHRSKADVPIFGNGLWVIFSFREIQVISDDSL